MLCQFITTYFATYFQINSGVSEQKDILALAFDTAFENVPLSPQNVTPVDDSAYSSSVSQDFFTSSSPEIENRGDTYLLSTSPTHIDTLQYELNWSVSFNTASDNTTSSEEPESQPFTEQPSSFQSSDSIEPQSSTSPDSEVASFLSSIPTAPVLSSSPVLSPSPLATSVASASPIVIPTSSVVPEHLYSVPNQPVSLSSSPNLDNLSSGSISSDPNELTDLFFVTEKTGNNNTDDSNQCPSPPTKQIKPPTPIPELKFSAISTLGNFFNSIPDISADEHCDEPPSKRSRLCVSPYMSETDWLELLVKCSSSSGCRCSTSPLTPSHTNVFSTNVHQQQQFASNPARNAATGYLRPQIMTMHSVPPSTWHQQKTSTLPDAFNQVPFNNPGNATRQSPRTKAEQRKGKPGHSYISLIANAILSSPNYQRSLPEIYDHIMEQHAFYRTCTLAWRNAVRHYLSANECFIKAERIDIGRGWTWTIHPSCIEQFKRGDFRRREARNRVQQHQRNGSYSPLKVIH